MIVGRYEFVDFRGLLAPFAESHLQRNRERARGGVGSCGTHALQTLTGLSGSYIERQRPNAPQRHLRGYWTDTATQNFLRNRGFKVVQVTKSNVTSVRKQGWYQWHEWDAPINNQHVLLCSMLMCEHEASWIIIHNGYTYHNFDCDLLKPLLPFNRPSQSVYLVWHKKWMNPVKEKI